MRAKEFVGTVVATEPRLGDAILLTFSCPAGLAETVRPGRYVQILCRDRHSFDPLLRRAFSLYSASRANETLSVLVRPFGRGTSWLAERRSGDRLDVIGVLGNAFSVSPTATNLLLVAGGVGVAPLVFLAEEAAAQGRSVTLLMGALDEESLLESSVLPNAIEFAVATDDGSRGHHGLVTNLVADYVRWADQVFACGPEPMYRSLKQELDRLRIGGRPSAQVSVDRPIACGVGACLCCIVHTRQGSVVSCVSGPVFDLDDIVW